MTVAYILEQNTSIRLEGQRLVVQRKKDIVHTLHLYKLSQLVIYGNVSLTPPVIARLLAQGIDTVFMSRHGRYQGRLQPPLSKNITLRRKQFEKMSDEKFCLEVARAIVCGKLSNMRAVIMRIKRSRQDVSLDGTLAKLKRSVAKAQEAEDLDSLRGLEGSGSAAYFEGFSRGFLGSDVRFEKRVRRPPTDPVNALLSLGYTLLLNNVMSAVSMAGFDPYLGALHTPEYGRPSLVLDLMEEWRPVVVDTLVLGVFNLKVLGPDDFHTSTDPGDNTLPGKEINTGAQAHGNEEPRSGALPVRLTDNGFRKFIVQFERKMNQKLKYWLSDQHLSYRDCIREQVRHFARVVREEDKEYRPMEIR